MKNRKKSEQNGVFAAIRMAAGAHPVLTAGTLLCVAGSVGASLVPPLLLARIIDRLTAGIPLTVQAVLLYFGSLALEGGLSSAQESLLVLFGQKMTHALRTEMSRKLTRLPASMLVRQNPGEVAARFPAMWTRWKPCSPPASSAWRRTPAASCPSWRSLQSKIPALR